MCQNLIWVVFDVEGCGVSSAEYSVHLVMCREFSVGKMAQDPDTGLSWEAFRG